MSDEKKPDPQTTGENGTADEGSVKSSHESSKQSAMPISNSNESGSFFSGLTGLISILALIGVGALGYFGYQQLFQISARIGVLEQQEKNSQAELQQLSKSLDTNFTQLQSDLNQSLDKQQSSNKEQLQEFSTQLSSTQRQVQSAGGRHRSDWLLAEADYLVRIATNRLLLERDHQTALALLLSADERIKLMDDPALQPIREALSNDMAKLRLVKRADIAGLAMRISSLIPQIKALPVLAFQLPEETINEADQSTLVSEPGWRQGLKNTFKELSVKWFEVRDHGRPVTPLMAPETEAILRTNMALLLQTTQFAVLRQHDELYHHSLQQLKNWSIEYFDATDPVVNAFINEVDLLDTTTVRVELPKTLESRLLIARQIELRFQQTNRSDAEEPASAESS